ncbi:3-deoxy-7-phosphoheptulonate synthase [Veronia pacifica]|uniref:Phospho-2-dehydro-3-deoxyheptonate aldolase n=1 Tax=Veronia pacifica TaxID=1080227 RepID=A0A1C3EJX8_9GAMM|nr:3-deoxy-7-phosphoheptulonate synthase [Veronia pacifica]ODA33535.1 3-deoxy-7-phosphoheptulonate synthase [Veronia pacifica]
MHKLANFIDAKALCRLPSVDALSEKISLQEQHLRWIFQQRKEIADVLAGNDPRLLVIVGPCSIHDTDAGLEYAEKLSSLKKDYQNELLVVMRTYFEKPRTRTGWKGLIVDPHLNDTHDIEAGLIKARRFLRDVIELGVPTATEFLDTSLYPYFSDLICWGAIGARTTESQIHRQMASGLPCPIGFKNGTDGNIDIAIDAIHAAKSQHLLCIPGTGEAPVAVLTNGNPNGHIILRGGKAPNYGIEHVLAAANKLREQQLNDRLIIDCSHGNSRKVAKNQLSVSADVARQIKTGDTYIAGVMCESFLIGGKQAMSGNELIYGKSVTDECLSWQDTKSFLDILAEAKASVKEKAEPELV